MKQLIIENSRKSLLAMHPLIAAELIQLARHDVEVRQRLLEENKLSPGYNPEMEVVHQQNAASLKKLLRSLDGQPYPK